MKLSTEKIRNAVLFQNGAIGDFLMSIFLAELLQKSGYVDHITIVVPRNLNFLKGLIGTYPYISAIEVSRRRGWAQLLKMIRRPCLVILQPDPRENSLEGKDPRMVDQPKLWKRVYWLSGQKSAMQEHSIPKHLFTIPISFTARTFKRLSVCSARQFLLRFPS